MLRPGQRVHGLRREPLHPGYASFLRTVPRAGVIPQRRVNPLQLAGLDGPLAELISPCTDPARLDASQDRRRTSRSRQPCEGMCARVTGWKVSALCAGIRRYIGRPEGPAAGALSSFTIGTATAVRAPASAVSCAAVCPDGARWGRPCPPFGAAPVWRWSTAHASLFRLKAYATFGNGSAHLLLIMLWITSNSNGSNSSMLFPRLTTALES